MIREQIKPALMTFLILTIITGVIYPLLVTGIAKGFFREKATGSLIYQNGKTVGSALIGQPFDDPRYFWSRPSATSPVSYNAAASSGSNFGPMNPLFIDAVKSRITAIKSADPDNNKLIPVDLITSSASGLDPHISLAGAYYQIPRIARLRGLSEDTLKTIVEQHTSGRFLGLIGEPVVSVLQLNLALDDLIKK
jgi:potassium-transporting ATPase KdpC subunit